MNKGIITLLAIFLVFIFMFASAHSQDEIIQVNNDVFLNPQRPATVFRHEEHNEAAEIEDCAQCHHLYEDGNLVEGESSEDMRCADCHKEDQAKKVPSLMQAFHLNCKGCHQEKNSGPVMCGECHLRQ